MARQRLRLEIDASPAYELILSLAAAAARGEGEAARFAGGCDMVWAHVLTVAYQLPPPRDIPALLEAVAAIHPRELRLRLLGYYVRWFRRATPPEVIAAAAGGDRAAAARFRETSYPDDARWQSALAALLPLGAEETRRRLLAVLRTGRDGFSAGYDPAVLAAEVAARRAQARSLPAERILAGVMDGWEYVPEPGINALLLIPSAAIWPDAHVFDHQETKIVCYPVAAGGRAGPEPPPDSLLRLGQALGDPSRLRVLRLLAAEELTATELAARLGVALTTLLHHLGRLREAGLVAAPPAGRRSYRLRREALAQVGPALERYLAG